MTETLKIAWNYDTRAIIIGVIKIRNTMHSEIYQQRGHLKMSCREKH